MCLSIFVRREGCYAAYAVLRPRKRCQSIHVVLRLGSEGERRFSIEKYPVQRTDAMGADDSEEWLKGTGRSCKRKAYFSAFRWGCGEVLSQEMRDW